MQMLEQPLMQKHQQPPVQEREQPLLQPEQPPVQKPEQPLLQQPEQPAASHQVVPGSLPQQRAAPSLPSTASVAQLPAAAPQELPLALPDSLQPASEPKPQKMVHWHRIASTDTLVDMQLPDAQTDGRKEYKKFWNSLNRCTGSTPSEILQHYQSLKGKRGSLTQLFEDWAQSGQNWYETSVLCNLRRKHTTRARGKWRLMDKTAMLQQYNQDEGLVAELIARKVKEGDFKPHFEFPNRVDMRLYRCWVSTEYDSEDELEKGFTMTGQREVDSTSVEALAAGGVFSASSVGALQDALHVLGLCNDFASSPTLVCIVCFPRRTPQLELCHLRPTAI